TISVAAIPIVRAPPIKVVALVKATVPSTRQKRGVVIKDPEEESSAKTPTETTSKDKGKEQIKEEESRAIASINETPTQKEAKRRKLIEEAKEAESIKQHLQRVPDEDDDVFTEATPLARKVPVVDYQIILLVERRYPITKFTLEQMLNVVRLQVEEESEMSLELIKFTRKQLQEAQHN
nr:hypothetical protein [Tanacetum cinerariifolium]